MLQSLLDIAKGIAIGTAFTAPLVLIGVHSGAFESRPPTTLYAQTATTITQPAARVAPFRHFGPTWHAVDTIPGLAESLAEGKGGPNRDWEDCAVRIGRHHSRVICPGGYTERWRS